MSQRRQQCADKIVARFRQTLGHDLAGQISEAQFNELKSLIREAMAEEAGSVAVELQQVVETLRAGQDKPELGL